MLTFLPFVVFVTTTNSFSNAEGDLQAACRSDVMDVDFSFLQVTHQRKAVLGTNSKNDVNSKLQDPGLAQPQIEGVPIETPDRTQVGPKWHDATGTEPSAGDIFKFPLPGFRNFPQEPGPHLPDRESTPPEPHVDLVVTWHCDNISWIERIQPDLAKVLSIFLYIKRDLADDRRADCNTALPKTTIPMKVRKVPNKGRDGHTQFEFIRNNYDHLATFTMFMQGGYHWYIGCNWDPFKEDKTCFQDNAEAVNYLVKHALKTNAMFLPVAPYNEYQEPFRSYDRQHNFNNSDQMREMRKVRWLRKFDNGWNDPFNTAREGYAIFFGGVPCNAPRLDYTPGMQYIVKREAITRRPLSAWARLADMGYRCSESTYLMERLSGMFFNSSRPMIPEDKWVLPTVCARPPSTEVKFESTFAEPWNLFRGAQFWRELWGCEPLSTTLRWEESWRISQQQNESRSVLQTNQNLTGTYVQRHVPSLTNVSTEGDSVPKSMPEIALISIPSSKAKPAAQHQVYQITQRKPATHDQVSQTTQTTQHQVSQNKQIKLTEVLFGVLLLKALVLCWLFQKPLENRVMVGFPHCFTWVVCTSVMVLFNKWILTEGKGNFPFYLTLNWWHLALSTLFTVGLRWLAPESFARSWMPAAVEGLDLTWKKWAMTILPLGLLFGMGLSLGTYSYVLCTVSFLQFMKAGIGPIMACAFSFIAGTEVVSLPLVQIIGAICLGDIIMFSNSITHIPYGALVQLACMVGEQTRLQLLQLFTSSTGNGKTKIDPLSALYFFAPVAMVIIGACAVTFEWRTESIVLQQRILEVGVLTWLSNGAVAVFLNVMTVATISKVGALTFVIVGIFKDACLLQFDTIIFETHTTSNQIVGFMVTAISVCMYSLYKCNRDLFCKKGLIHGIAFIIDEATAKMQTHRPSLKQKVAEIDRKSVV